MRTLSATLVINFGVFFFMSLPTAFCHAGTESFEVTGMTCGACVKQVKAKVCHLKGIDKCEVEVGKVSLTAKSGQTIDREEISKAITSADKNFKVVTPKKQ